MRAILFVLIVFTCFSCKKLEEIKIPDFDIEVSKQIYRVGDSVVFNFRGGADVISVYTGEIRYDYDSINGRIMPSEFKIGFESQIQLSTQTQSDYQRNQLYILVSKNFNENYTLEGVSQADWTDVTERFTFPETRSSTFVHSGWGDITDQTGDDDSTKIYVAVKHVVRDQSMYGDGSLNRIRNLKLQAVNELGATDIFTHSPSNWTLFSTPNKESDRQTIEDTQMTLRNNWRTPNVYTEDWVVSKPIMLHHFTDMGPDHAIGIKSLADSMPKTYTKIYSQAGEYRVVFKAINQSAAGRKEVLKEVNITVLP